MNRAHVHHRIACLAIALLTMTSCGDPAGPGDQDTPGLHVISGAGVTDTIEARLRDPVVIVLRDSSGRALVGQVLRVSGSGATYGVYPTAIVSKSPTGAYVLSYTDTTDAAGRISVYVRLGASAGAAGVTVQTADAALHTDASFTVLPGAPASVTVSPADTATYAGRNFQLAAVVRDRAGNLRTDTPTYSSLTPTVASVTTAGAVATKVIGRGALRATIGSLADTAYVSVPPVGVISASTSYGSSSNPIRTRVYTVNLDGSARTEVVSSTYWSEPSPAFSPDGRRIAFSLGDYNTRLYVSAGGATQLLIGGSPLAAEGYSRYSRDGQWIYFSGRPGHQNCEIWRVRSDGTGAERIGPPVDDYQIDANPDPSPDGTRVVYNTNRVASTMPVIRMLDVATRQVTALDVRGISPRWSPDGTRIAYIPTAPSWDYIPISRVLRHPGPLMLMLPDGTGHQVIPTGLVQFDPMFAWSPDGKYIIGGTNTGVLAIVIVATGEVLPLPFSADLQLPDWKP